LWPSAAAGGLLLGLVVAWGLRGGAGNRQDAVVQPETPVLPRPSLDDQAAAIKPVYDTPPSGIDGNRRLASQESRSSGKQVQSIPAASKAAEDVPSIEQQVQPQPAAPRLASAAIVPERRNLEPSPAPGPRSPERIGGNRPPDGRSTPGARPAVANPQVSADDAHLAPPTRGSPAAVFSGDAQPAAIAFTTGTFDPALLVRKPVRAKVTLEKVLATPGSYANQVVVPTGMYHLARSLADRPGGPRKSVVTERTIESRAADGALEMRSSFSTELELEPRLAERLDGLDPAQREDKVAILTLWVTGAGACGLVKVEILEKTTHRVKKGYLAQPDINYETLLVTPVGSRLGKGDDGDWEQVGRMISFANEYKRRFKAHTRMVKDAEKDQITAQMNVMFGEMMRNALIQEQNRRALEQRLLRGR
jgi:hypothetical protein